MYVTSLACDFGDFGEEMVVSLKKNLSAPENVSQFSFAVEYLGCVSGGRRNLYMLWCYDLSFMYGGQLFFVDKYWQKVERMSSHHFWFE